MELLTDWLPTIAALIATGVVAGTLAGLLGVGGGIVIVPVLFLVFQSIGVSSSSAMLIATATSLLSIVPTSISSARSHNQRGNVNWGLLKFWTPPMLIGVAGGAYLVTQVNGLVLTIIFGVVAILAAVNMLLRANAKPLSSELPSKIIQAIIASIIGFFSVMMGIGGATLGVPSMTAFDIPLHRAVGTAAVFGLVIALAGSLIMLTAAITPDDAPRGTIGLVNLPGFAVIVPLSVVFAPLGVKLGSKLSGSNLKRIFALFLILVGLRMLWQAF